MPEGVPYEIEAPHPRVRGIDVKVPNEEVYFEACPGSSSKKRHFNQKIARSLAQDLPMPRVEHAYGRSTSPHFPPFSN